MFKGLDRTSIVVIAICIILIFSWSYIFGPKGLNILPQTPPQSQTAQKETAPLVKTDNAKGISETTGTAISEQNSIAKEVNPSPASTQDISGKKSDILTSFSNIPLSSPSSSISAVINPNTGAIVSIKLNDILDANKDKDVVLDLGVEPGALSLTSPGNSWKLKKVYTPILNGKDDVSVKRLFETENGISFALVQNWRLGKGYTIDYSVRILNSNKEFLILPEVYIWDGGMPPVQYLSGDVARSEAHRLDALLSSNNDLISIKGDEKGFPQNVETNDSIRWLAVSNKYFACILKPLNDNGNFYGGFLSSRTQESKVINNSEHSYYVVSGAGIIRNVNVAPQSTKEFKFQYYAGPKEIHLLNAFAPHLNDIMHLAFSVLEYIAIWLLYLLIFLKGFVGSYGWSIILLTVLVKLAFWPITHKSNVSMKKMQKIQPKMKAIREQYKDDKQKLNAKMMELYKTEGVSPVGGCLPILIQIPVFFALYWTLDGAIELRHSSFLWIKDLTMPDTIGHIMGLPINPLAILMALTMVLQQKLTPTATDPTQAKMMMFMPIIMLIFLYNLPSGLTLYWTVSQIISIIQLLVNIYLEKKEHKSVKVKTV